MIRSGRETNRLFQIGEGGDRMGSKVNSDDDSLVTKGATHGFRGNGLRWLGSR